MNFPPRSLHLAVLACLLAPPLAGCGGGSTPQVPAANLHPADAGTVTPSYPASATHPSEGTTHERGTQTSSDQSGPAAPGVQPPPGAAQKLPTTDGAAKTQYAGVYVYEVEAPAAPTDLLGKIRRVTVSIDPSGHIEGSALSVQNVLADNDDMAYSFHGQLPKAGTKVTMSAQRAHDFCGNVTLKLVPGTTNGTITLAVPDIAPDDQQVLITRPTVKPWLRDGVEKFRPRQSIVMTAGADRLLGNSATAHPIRLTRDGTSNRWHLQSQTARLHLSGDLTPTGVAGVFDASIHLSYPFSPRASKVIRGYATLDVDAETGSRRLMLSCHGDADTHVLILASSD